MLEVFEFCFDFTVCEILFGLLYFLLILTGKCHINKWCRACGEIELFTICSLNKMFTNMQPEWKFA